jgi:hypothetical protein
MYTLSLSKQSSANVLALSNYSHRLIDSHLFVDSIFSPDREEPRLVFIANACREATFTQGRFNRILARTRVYSLDTESSCDGHNVYRP